MKTSIDSLSGWEYWQNSVQQQQARLKELYQTFMKQDTTTSLGNRVPLGPIPWSTKDPNVFVGCNAAIRDGRRVDIEVGQRWYFLRHKGTLLGKIIGITHTHVVLKVELGEYPYERTEHISTKPETLLARAPKRWWNPFDK